jgi:UDP-2,4-diacetamido-2,4,6-trideoxy-beta-L-altropyranose hydrolase
VTVRPLRTAIRADASPRIGIGHVKRCLSLAEALIGAGVQVHLIARDLGVDIGALARPYDISVISLPRPRGATVVDDEVAHAHWAEVSWQEDVTDTLVALENVGVDWVIVDHYSLDAKWHEALRQRLGANIAVIDDLADRALSAQLLIDQNYAADHRKKYAYRLPAAARILGGPRFALLAGVYRNAPRYQFREECRSIGIFMGGADASDWSSVVLRAIREYANFTGDVAIATTSANPNLERLKQLARQWPRTTVEVDRAELSAFFASHDLQIGAGGGATWERCCIGPPTFGLVCADNQRVVIDELRELRALATLDPGVEPSAPALGLAIRALIDAPAERQRIAQRARALVDGRGAERVACHVAAASLRLRAASMDDAALMFAWRNHPTTREVSGDSRPLEWDAHLGWLERVLVDAARILQVATIGSVPVGVIRYDELTVGEAEVSLYLDPDMLGLGLGAGLLRAGEQTLRARWPQVRRLVATVLDANVASQRMFTADGYVRRDDGRYLKTLQT